MPEATASAPAAAPLEADAHTLAQRDRHSLALQRVCTAAVGPLTVPAAVFIMRHVMGWRIRHHRRLRRELHQELSANRSPLLMVANHLTYYDSPILAWALAPVWRLVFQPRFLPWNVPERKNFAANLPGRVLSYLLKCQPIERGGDRRQTTRVLDRLAHLMQRGEAVLIFPEGRRSLTGRVDPADAAYGVGRLVKSVPGTRVLCLYMRGEHQEEPSFLAARNEVFDLSFSWLEPRTERRGVRASLEITRQILDRLSEMEEAHFDARQ